MWLGVGQSSSLVEGEVQHKTDGDDDANPNILEYPTDDAHPSRAGNQKATVEFVPLWIAPTVVFKVRSQRPLKQAPRLYADGCAHAQSK